METSTIYLQGKVKNRTICRRTATYSVLGLKRPSSGTLSGEGTKIESARYGEMLTDRLKPVIRSKRRGLLSKGVLLHDNARAHSDAPTVETLRKSKFDIMTHPPYSPELSLSDYTCLVHSKRH